MISAVAALRLPSALLSEEQEACVVEILGKIEQEITANMRFEGVTVGIAATNAGVIAALGLALKRAGWNAKWTPIPGPRLAATEEPTVRGYVLSLAPSEAAYEAAREPLN